VAHQCIRCAWYNIDQPPPNACPDCGCKNFRTVSLRYGLKNAELDRPSVESVAHLKKRLDKCINYDLDPLTKAKTYHDLKLARDVTKTAGNDRALVQITESCSECGLKYTMRSIPVTRTDILQKLGIKLEDVH
jgi:predicted  nucleic acid-binding Zn-ribbon protein